MVVFRQHTEAALFYLKRNPRENRSHYVYEINFNIAFRAWVLSMNPYIAKLDNEKLFTYFFTAEQVRRFKTFFVLEMRAFDVSEIQDIQKYSDKIIEKAKTIF